MKKPNKSILKPIPSPRLKDNPQICCYLCGKVLEGFQTAFWRNKVKRGYKLRHIDCEPRLEVK